jgi:hypothetical protein
MGRRDDVPKVGEKGWFPDHTAERRAELPRATPGERVAEAIELSRPPHGSQRSRNGSVSGDWDEDARVPAQQLDAGAILRTLLDSSRPLFAPGHDRGRPALCAVYG